LSTPPQPPSPDSSVESPKWWDVRAWNNEKRVGVALVVVFFLGMMIGGDGAERRDLEQQLASSQGNLEDVREERDELSDNASSLSDELATTKEELATTKEQLDAALFDPEAEAEAEEAAREERERERQQVQKERERERKNAEPTSSSSDRLEEFHQSFGCGDKTWEDCFEADQDPIGADLAMRVRSVTAIESTTDTSFKVDMQTNNEEHAVWACTYTRNLWTTMKNGKRVTPSVYVHGADTTAMARTFMLDGNECRPT